MLKRYRPAPSVQDVSSTEPTANGKGKGKAVTVSEEDEEESGYAGGEHLLSFHSSLGAL